jgi:hypothetical protein
MIVFKCNSYQNTKNISVNSFINICLEDIMETLYIHIYGNIDIFT